MIVISLCFCPGLQVFLASIPEVVSGCDQYGETFRVFFIFYFCLCVCLSITFLRDRNFNALLSFMVFLQDRSVLLSPEAVWFLSNSCY